MTGEQTRTAAATNFSGFQTAYPYVPQGVVLLFCVFVLAKYLQIGYRIPFLGDIRFELIFSLILTAVAIPYGGRFSHPAAGWALALVGCMLVGMPFSYNVPLSWDVFVDRVFKFAFLTYFIGVFCKGPRQLKYFVGAFLLAFLKMGQEGFLGQITGSLVWENQGVLRLHGATPMYAHPNSFSGTMMGTLPFVYFLFPIVSWPLRSLLLVQTAFIVNAVIFTGSRTGYIAAVGMIPFLLRRSKKKLKWLLGFSIVALVGVMFIPEDYVGRFQSIFTGKDKEGQSTEARKQILEDAWAIFVSHPLGVGVGAFPTVRLQTFGRSQDTHNLYLEVATNIGIQGLLVFVIWIYMITRSLNRSVRGFEGQVNSVVEALRSQPANGPPVHAANQHLADLRFYEATAKATHLFIVIRLILGLFGMDLYELYWWFGAGLAIALTNIEPIAAARTAEVKNWFVSGAPAIAPARERTLRGTP